MAKEPKFRKIEKEEKTTKAAKVVGKISEFFIQNRKILVIVGIALIVGLIVLSTFLIINDKNQDKLQVAVESLQKQEEALVAGEISDEEFQALVDDLSAIVKKGKNSYAGVKASYILGLAYQKAENNDKAYEMYMSVVQKNFKSYLAPLALFNAAAAKDDMGDQQEALKLYERIPLEYGYDAGVAPKALFNSARIHLANGDTELAKSTFQQIIDQYSGTGISSEYVALSQNAILTL